MKLGGEKLTRQRIKLEKAKFAEKPELFKRRAPIVPKEPVDPTPAADEKKVAPETTTDADETTTPTASTPAAEKKRGSHTLKPTKYDGRIKTCQRVFKMPILSGKIFSTTPNSAIG